MVSRGKLAVLQWAKQVFRWGCLSQECRNSYWEQTELGGYVFNKASFRLLLFLCFFSLPTTAEALCRADMMLHVLSILIHGRVLHWPYYCVSLQVKELIPNDNGLQLISYSHSAEWVSCSPKRLGTKPGARGPIQDPGVFKFPWNPP